MTQALTTPELSQADVQPLLTPAFVRVREFVRETHDIFTLKIEPPKVNGKPFLIRPGQFNMLYLFGIGEVPISLSGDAEDPSVIVHTVRAVGSVTNALSRLQPGDMIGLRGPFGSNWPLAEARGHDVVLVSGGIGLMPLRPVVYHLLKHRKDFGRIVLLQGVRTPRDLLYPLEMEAWSHEPDVQVLVTVDAADATWTGRVGVVTTLFKDAVFAPARTMGMMCGPEVMMRFAQREFEKRGVPEDQLYVSLERNMQCAIGMCGHCQFGPSFVCLDGPVFRFDRIRRFWEVREA
ncbi:MAG TPA: FAD/NAD(P)-binding protein [Gemmataceae bacterium]|nr:FAD/NAD(P)-binding protein [Gemmataceae bacterium]